MAITLDAAHPLFANITNALLVDDDDVAKDVIDGTALTLVGTTSVSTIDGKRHLTCVNNTSGARRTRTVTPSIFTVMVASYLRASANQFATIGGVSYDSAGSNPFAVGWVGRNFDVAADLFMQTNNGGAQTSTRVVQTGIPKNDVSFAIVDGATSKYLDTAAGQSTVLGSSAPSYTATSQVFMGEPTFAGRNPSADILHVVIFNKVLSAGEITSLRADPSQLFLGYGGVVPSGWPRRRSRKFGLITKTVWGW